MAGLDDDSIEISDIRKLAAAKDLIAATMQLEGCDNMACIERGQKPFRDGAARLYAAESDKDKARTTVQMIMLESIFFDALLQLVIVNGGKIVNSA